jgi:hypothetical protein
MMMLHIPEDKELLAAFGEVALRHEHLNHILRMTIKTLARLTLEEALDATSYDGSRQLRERIRKLARQRLGEGEPLLKLQALLERCKRATEKRNQLVHCVWAKELDGEPQSRGPDHQWQPLPTVEELSALAKELQLLTDSLNTARLDGFLSEALSKRKG